VEGKVLVQTYRSFHPVYEALKTNDFTSLSTQELESRETFHYPPYTRLIEIFLKHKDEQAVISAAMVFNNLIRPVFKDTLLGPITPSVSKIRNMYIQQFMIKLDVSAQNSTRVKQYLLQKKEELIFAENMNGVYVEFNVDPY
jgi:primosomal protein N' (replication factor Y)